MEQLALMHVPCLAPNPAEPVKFRLWIRSQHVIGEPEFAFLHAVNPPSSEELVTERIRHPTAVYGPYVEIPTAAIDAVVNALLDAFNP